MSCTLVVRIAGLRFPFHLINSNDVDFNCLNNNQELMFKNFITRYKC